MTDRQTLAITLTLVALSYVMLIIFIGLLVYYCVAVRKKNAAKRRAEQGTPPPVDDDGDTASATPVKDDQRSVVSNGTVDNRQVAEVLPVVAVCDEQMADSAPEVTSPAPPDLPPRPVSYFDEPAEEDRRVSRGSVMERISLYETIERRCSSPPAASPTDDDVTPYEDLATIKRKLRMTVEQDDDDEGGSVPSETPAEPIYSKPDPKRKDTRQSVRDNARSTTSPPGDQSMVEPTTPVVPPKNGPFSFTADDVDAVNSY